MYSFSNIHFNKNKELIRLELDTKKWSILLINKNEHIHVSINGPLGYRKRSFTSIKSNINEFEAKVVALYFYKLSRDSYNRGEGAFACGFKSTNYAEIFGSLFD